MAAEIVVALAGNPNAGKTTIFNQLTGAHQTVGNWPGVTVEKKEGTYTHAGNAYRVVDLPGIYTLNAYTEDEIVARDFLWARLSRVAVDVVDASHLGRNLYLTTELLEMGANVVVAFNMYDTAAGRAARSPARAAALLGAAVVPTVGTTGAGIPALKEAVVAAARRVAPPPPLHVDYGPELEPHLAALASLAADVCRPLGFEPRWVALKLVEGGEGVKALVGRFDWAEAMLNEAAAVARHVRQTTGIDAAVLIAERRYGFIAGLLRELTGPAAALATGPYTTTSDRVDRILTNRSCGVPIFLATAFAVFQISTWGAAPMVEGCEWALARAAKAINALAAPFPLVASLLVNGVLGGVGSVMVFLPSIFLLFFAFAALEDTGYMARVAYVLDTYMHRLGLHGRSFIPLLMGFSCNVPAVMAARTLERRRDRFITILVIPFISCSARLPVYILFAGAFFPGRRSLVIWALYLLSVALAAGSAKVLGALLFRGESAHFVMELPAYHIPSLRGLLIHGWERTWDFARRAGLIIFAASVLLWGLANLPPGVAYADRGSMLGTVGAFIAPVFAPAGFGRWEAAVALISGFIAKELLVGALAVVYGAAGAGLATALRAHFTPLAAISFLIMTLVYVPCVATVAAIRRETNSWRWTGFAVGYTIILGWSLATAAYQLGKLLGWG